MTKPTRSYVVGFAAIAAILSTVLWSGADDPFGLSEANDWIALLRIAIFSAGLLIGVFVGRTEFLAMLVATFLLSAALVALTIPSQIAAAVAFGSVALLRLKGRGEALLFSATIFLTVAAVYAVGESFFDRSIEQQGTNPASIRFYRPDEMLLASAPEYPRLSANRTANGFEMPYGDLYPLSNFSLLRSMLEPRVLNFSTNARGHRNNGEYKPGQLVLIGDSFGLGSGGATQDELLTEILGREFGIPVYNASFPTDPAGYLQIHAALKEQIALPFKTIFMFFEGNDFDCPGEDLRHLKPTIDAPVFLRKRETFKIMFGISRQFVQAIWSAAGVTPVVVYDVGDKKVAFLNAYRRVSERTEACGLPQIEGEFEAIRDEIALIVFIPTKFRTYQRYVWPGHVLPNVQGAYLKGFADSINVPFLDLTNALRTESARLLPGGEYTFWRDDTHWNPNGIRVAAREIAKMFRNGVPVATASASDRKTRAESSAIGGYVDLVRVEGQHIDIVGWAADTERGDKALAVIAVEDGKRLASTSPTNPRPDVAAAYANPNFHQSGFAFRLPVELLTGRQHLRFLALLPGFRAARLEISPEARTALKQLRVSLD